MNDTAFGPVTRSLLGVRDSLLRRCWWCGDVQYGLSPCTTCHSNAHRPSVEDAA